MSQADPCRTGPHPVEDARLFARDALRAARAAWSQPANEGAGMMALFTVLAIDALFPELLVETPSGDVHPHG